MVHDSLAKLTAHARKAALLRRDGVGHKDTDAIFTILRKTLGPLGIKVQRVDRIEHNDSIDTRIISEIEAADWS